MTVPGDGLRREVSDSMRLLSMASGRWRLGLAAVVALLLTISPAGAAAVEQPGPIMADAVAGLVSIKVNGPDGTGATDGTGLVVAGSEVRSGADAGRRSVALSSPMGPGMPGVIEQAAGPDNLVAKTQRLQGPEANQLVEANAFEGTVHARWNPESGPCADPLNFAQTSVGSVAAVGAIPALPKAGGLPGAPVSTPNLDFERMVELKRAAEGLAGPWSELGGLLSSDALLRLSNTAAAGTQVRLVEAPGRPGRAVQSISSVQLSNLRLLPGTSQELQLNVLRQPKLVATSTGEEATSNVEYTPPVVQILQGGREIHRLSVQQPSFDAVIGLAPPGAPRPAALGLSPLVGPAFRAAVGDRVLDVGVLRVALGQFSEQRSGTTVGGVARALDISLLPTNLPLPGLPETLAQVSVGQHSVRAGAPPGGVLCPPGQAMGSGEPAKPPLAQTNGANYARELTAWGGSMLLLGSILVAALPARPRQSSHILAGRCRSPR